MKKLLLCVFIASAFVYSTFANGEGEESSGVLKLKLANELSTEHTGNIIIRYFADKVKEYSDGKIEITIFPNGTLGTTKELIEQAQAGTIDFVQSGGAYLENFSPEYAVFGLPYVFKDKEHFVRAMNGPLGEKFQNEVPATFKLKSVLYLYAGTRSFYATKPLNSIDDLQGLKIRVQPSNVALATVKALGADPTPMSFGEVYSALQQGVLDGAENNPTSYLSAGHYEVAKYFIFDEHQSIPDFLLMNKEKWESLTQDQQQVISKAAQEAQAKALVDWDAQRQAAIDKGKAAGSTFVQLVQTDKAPFQKKVQDFIEETAASSPVIAELLGYIRDSE